MVRMVLQYMCGVREKDQLFMIKLGVFKENVNIIMQVTILSLFKSWKYCFQR